MEGMICMFKKVMGIFALGLGLLAFNPSLEAEAAASSKESAQKLVDALEALNLDNVDYLYTYLQSVELTENEYKGIISNAEAASNVLGKVSSPEDLSNADRAKVGRLFLDSAQKAHLDVAFVDENGKAIDLKNLDLSNASSLKILIKDTKGNVLASIDPTLADFNPAALNAKLAALKTAVEAKVELDTVETFVPMPSSKLPNTASDLPLGIAVGGLLVVLGGLALVPSIRTVRRMGSQA